jgi:hypothetical protein
MPTIDTIQSQVKELPVKALEAVKAAQDQVVEFVGKAAGTVAERLPQERPELLVRGVDAYEGSFAQQVVDTEVAFVKAVVDAVVTPFAPAKPAPVKRKPAAKAA